jgi:c-di-GMP-related signal transduction protein
MAEIIEKIRLGQPIISALLKREGYLGKLLLITEKLEKTDQIQIVIENLAPKINLSAEKLYQIYAKAYNFSVAIRPSNS